MAIVAEKEGFAFESARCEVEKEMIPNPRRIGSLKTVITLPASLSQAQRIKMEETAKGCPVTKSLHPELAIPLTFIYE